MDIVDSSPDHLNLHVASRLAGCSTKTLRRAIQDGHFPRHYVLSPRGPQLVFRRQDLEHWVAERGAKSRMQPRARGKRSPRGRDWDEISAHISDLQATLTASRDILATLRVKLQEQDQVIANTQQLVFTLTARLSSVPHYDPTPETALETLVTPYNSLLAENNGSAI